MDAVPSTRSYSHLMDRAPRRLRPRAAALAAPVLFFAPATTTQKNIIVDARSGHQPHARSAIARYRQAHKQHMGAPRNQKSAEKCSSCYAPPPMVALSRAAGGGSSPSKFAVTPREPDGCTTQRSGANLRPYLWQARLTVAPPNQLSQTQTNAFALGE